MTTYTGKDVTFKIAGSTVGYTQEVSFEIANGQLEIKEIGLETIKEFAWTQINASGSFSIIHTTYDIINDVLTYGTTKNLSLEFGSVPDYTLTFNNVKYESFEISFSLEEPVKSEMSWKAETVQLT